MGAWVGAGGLRVDLVSELCTRGAHEEAPGGSRALVCPASKALKRHTRCPARPPAPQGRIFVLSATGGKFGVVCEKETRGAVCAAGAARLRGGGAQPGSLRRAGGGCGWQSCRPPAGLAPLPSPSLPTCLPAPPSEHLPLRPLRPCRCMRWQSSRGACWQASTPGCKCTGGCCPPQGNARCFPQHACCSWGPS